MEVIDLSGASPSVKKRPLCTIDVDGSPLVKTKALCTIDLRDSDDDSGNIVDLTEDSKEAAAPKRRRGSDGGGAAAKRTRAVAAGVSPEGARARRRSDARREEAATFASTPGVAARLCESTRDCRRDGLELRNCCANFDLAVAFLERHAEMLASAPCPKSGKNKGARATPLCVAYHGTSRANFRRIMDGNLAVPDGRTVRHATDDGYFGRGIYTTTRHELAFAYARDGIVFACLALPGRQHRATQARDRGAALRRGYDSHLGYEADGCPQLVFFKSNQLLPVYLVDRANVGRATAALERVVAEVAKAAGNARPKDGLPRSRKGRGLPAPGTLYGAGPAVAAKMPHLKGMPPALAAYLKGAGDDSDGDY